MDKLRLNNEIILCRPAVRKAKVAVIRKILKKMKILKSCKKDDLKEKKLRKADRLFEKVQIMKRTRVDDVTKFALRTDLEEPTAKPSLEHSALSILAKHEAIVKRVNAIRELIPDWKVVLPPMLDTLGRKRLAKLNRKNMKKMEKEIKKGKSPKDKLEEVPKTRTDEVSKVKKQIKPKVKPVQKVKKLESVSDDEKEDSSVVEEEAQVKEEKIEDPFFIEKKVIAPKLVKENMKKQSNDKSDRTRAVWDSSLFHAKPFKAKKEPRFEGSKTRKTITAGKVEEEEEKLHPSWAAKKVKLIKPFEGKKIKFSDD